MPEYTYQDERVEAERKRKIGTHQYPDRVFPVRCPFSLDCGEGIGLLARPFQAMLLIGLAAQNLTVLLMCSF